MENKQVNLDRELKILNLFDYKLGPNIDNEYLIYDKNQTKVGFIKLDEISTENEETKITKKIFINSPILYMVKENDDDYNFEFYIKRENGSNDIVQLYIGEDFYPSIRIYRNEHVIIDFEINYERMFAMFQSSNYKCNTEELVIYKDGDDVDLTDKEYYYQIKYTDKWSSINYKNYRFAKDIEAKYNPFTRDENKLNLTRQTWYGNKNIYKESAKVDGTIEEMVSKHQTGIDAFNRFRLLINKLLSTENDFFSTMVSDDLIKERKLDIFLKDEIFNLIPEKVSLVDYKLLYKFFKMLKERMLFKFTEKETNLYMKLLSDNMLINIIIEIIKLVQDNYLLDEEKQWRLIIQCFRQISTKVVELAKKYKKIKKDEDEWKKIKLDLYSSLQVIKEKCPDYINNHQDDVIDYPDMGKHLSI